MFAVLAHGGGYATWLLVVTALLGPPIAIVTLLVLARQPESASRRSAINVMLFLMGLVCAAAGRASGTEHFLRFSVPHAALAFTVLFAGASKDRPEVAARRAELRKRLPAVLVLGALPYALIALLA
jgi:hypothetical protein